MHAVKNKTKLQKIYTQNKKLKKYINKLLFLFRYIRFVTGSSICFFSNLAEIQSVSFSYSGVTPWQAQTQSITFPDEDCKRAATSQSLDNQC